DRPESITVYLLANGEQVDEVDVTAESNWTYEFTDLDKYDDQGIEFTYTVDEEAVAGYEKSIEGNDITNLRVGTTEVSGTKTWKDDSSEERPESIKVNLLQNGVVIDTVEVTAEDDWKYSFTDLDQYDNEGVAYEYEVKEQGVPGYKSEVDGFDITNTRSDLTSVVVTKGWLDDHSDDRPDSITVHLLQNGDIIETVQVTAAEDWTYEFTDLDAYDENGVAYEYTIEEEAVEGYETTIDGFDITNLRVGETEVSGTKTWEEDDPNDRPESITVNLLANGEQVGSQEVTADMDWTYAFTNLPAFDAEGKAIKYTVEEVEVPGYKTHIDGFDITNTWIPVDPEDPTEPEIPDDPKDPIKPEDPKDPSKPEDPKEPGKPEEPSEPASGDPESQDKGDQLPKTATNMYNMILIGTILLAGGVVLWLLSRRRDDTV
ncbi:MAG TPA: Cna B-type domain-containing protein, partial [Virgibacillus sp.]|nr:Cna B-type domain-containing protein [Virgibacillus sp.]